MIGEDEVRFDKDLYNFLSMALEIWPTLKSGAKHLQEIEEQNANSFLPKRNYSQMSQQTFYKTVTDDLFEFIMSHDVKADDIEDYLYDILDLLMIEEELIGGNKNPASINYMSSHIIRVMEELQSGKKTLVNDFEVNIYNNVKMFKGQVIEEKNGSEDSEQESGSQEMQQQQEKEQIQEKKVEPLKQKKSQEQMKREQELEEDGWVIVRK